MRPYDLGFGISLLGVFGIFVSSALRDWIDRYRSPGVKLIKKAIGDMRSGLEELQDSVNDLVEEVSFFSK